MAAFTPVGVEAVVKNLNGFNRGLGSMAKSIDGLSKAADGSTGKLGGFSSALGGIAKATGTTLLAGIGAATAAIVGLGVAGVTAAIDYESAFAGVLKTTDGLTDSAGELTAAGEELRQGFIDLSKVIPIDASTLANIGELGGQLGVSRENLISFTETIAQLGVTTNLATEDAAQQFAQLANIMGTAQGDFDRMGSSVVALGNNFATTERDIVNFASRIAGAGSIAGLTEADIFGIGAAMSSVGIEAEAGGTAVQKVLLGINTAVIESNDKLQVFANTAGMSAEKFATLWEEDAGQAFQLFVEGLGAAGDDAIGILDELDLTDQRLTRAFLSLAGAGDLLGESIQTSNQAWADNTALSAEAEQRFATTESKIQLLKNTFDALKIAIGTPFLDVIQKLVDAFRGFVDENGVKVEQFFTNISEAIGKFVENINTGIDPLTNFQALLSRVLQAFGVDQSDAMTFAINFREAFEGVVTFWETTLQPALSTLIAFLQENIPVAMEALRGFWEGTLKPALDGIWQTIQENVIPAVEDIIESFGKLREWWDQNGEAVGGLVSGFVDGISEGFAAITETVVPSIIEQFDKIVNWWVENGPLMTPIIEDLSEDMRNMGSSIEEAWVIIEPILTGITDGVLGIGETVLKMANDDWDGAWLSAEATLEGVGENISKFIFAIVEEVTGVEDAAAELEQSWSGVWDLIGEALITASDKIGDTLNEMSDSIGEALDEAVKAAEQFALDLIDSIQGTAGDIASVFTDFDWSEVGASILQGIATGVKNNAAALNDEIRALAQRAWDTAVDALRIGSPSKVFEVAGISIVDGVIVGIKGQNPLLMETVRDTGRGTTDAFVDGMQQTKPFLLDAAMSTLSAVTEAANEVVSSAPQRISFEPFAEIGERLGAAMIRGFRKESDKALDIIKDTLSAASALSGLFVKEFERQTFGPLEERAERLAQNMERFTSELNEAFGRELEEAEVLDLISQAVQQEAGLFDFGLTPEQLIAINRVIDIRKANAQLTKEEEEAQERLLQIERQRQQLGFLQEQLKLLQLIRDAGLDPQAILGGLELGLDADVSGLLAATAAATQALIDQAEADLGIGSPSKVFMEIGRNVMAGLMAGIQTAVQFPRQAVAQATQMMTPNASTVNNNTQNVTINASISNGMDLAGFQAAANRALGNGVLI